jgi:hypothetical protein
MTFVVGIRCMDGLVIAADSLERDGYKRRYRNKLEIVSHKDEWAMCWGSAGNSDVIDKFSDKLKQCLRDIPYDRNKIENIVEQCLQAIKKKYPNAQVGIVAGLFGQRPKDKHGRRYPEYHLYKGDTEQRCVWLEQTYCCAGMDDSLAEFMLRNTYSAMGRAMEVVWLGVFVTSVMKEYADGVGGKVNAVYINNSTLQWIPLLRHQIEDAEKKLPITDIEKLVSEFWRNGSAKRFWEWFDGQAREAGVEIPKGSTQ